MNLKKILFSYILLLLVPSSVLGQLACDFNKPIEQISYYSGMSREIQRPQQGWVENFGGAIESIQDTAAGLYWGSCEDASGITGVTPGEVFALNCSGIHGNAYSFSELDELSDFTSRTENHLDDMEEELLFSTAVQNIHHLAKCQNGLFQDYFDAQNPARGHMLRRAYERFEEKRPKILETLANRAPLEVSRARAQNYRGCIKDSCLGADLETTRAVSNSATVEESLAESDVQLKILLSSIPMGNRENMREALLQLYRVNPEPSMEQFAAVFDREMQTLNSQVDSTLGTVNSIHHPTESGDDLYCVNSNLKRQLYRSGQLEIVLQNLGIDEHDSNISCRMGRRYGMAGEVITELALIPTYLFGYPLARLALRAGVASVSARGAQALNLTSRLGLLGIQGADLTLFSSSAIRACLSDDFMVGLQGRSCSAEAEFAQSMHEAEIGNCIANIALFGVSNTVALRSLRQGQREVAEALNPVRNGDGLRNISRNLEGDYPIVSTRTRTFAGTSATEQVRTIEFVDDQIDFLTRSIPGSDPTQLRYLITRAREGNVRIVFGGSRIRGAGEFRESSDLDVGFFNSDRSFRNLEKFVQKTVKDANSGDLFPNGLEIEKGVKIFNGNETPTISRIDSPEEFFMRSGVRQDPDPRAGEAYDASGYLSISPEGEVIIGIPTTP